MLKIYIDAGHGGKDPGAVSGGFQEAQAALKIALAVNRHLQDYACLTRLSRTTDKFLSPQERYKEAIAWGANLSICCHLNAGGGEGFEVFAWHTDARSQAFGKLLAAEMPGIGQILRGSTFSPGVKLSKPGSYNFGMVREPAKKGIIAVLCEAAFIDNAKDRARVDSDAKLNAFGAAYGRAIVKQLGLTGICAPLPEPEPKRDYTVIVPLAGYYTAEDAAKRQNRKVIVNPGGYYIYKAAQGMLNVSSKATSPGSWINPADNTKAKPKPTIVKGSTVLIVPGSKTYEGKKLANFVFARKHKVKELKGDRAVLTYAGIVVAAVNVANLTLI